MTDDFSDEILEGLFDLGEEVKREQENKASQQTKKANEDAKDILKTARYVDGISIWKDIRSYVAELPIPQGKILIKYSEIMRSRQSFEVLLNITLHHITEGILPSFEQRLDLNSQSAVSSLSTNLNKAYGKDQNWVLMLNKAGNALKKLIVQEKRPLMAKEEIMPVDFLLFPILQKGSANMVFADSEVGKSFFALYMAAIAISGQDFFSFPTKPFKTLYLDYEDDYDTFSFRLHSVCTGNGIDFSEIRKSIKYHKPDGDMVDEAEIVARMVEEENFDLIIIDAGSSATGGDPLNSTPVIKLFDALERIPCTKLIIHHEGKATEGKTDGQAVYGTTFWKARIRVGWRLSCLQESKDSDGSEKTIQASMFKGSNLGRQDAFMYRFRFHKEGITFTKVNEFQPSNESNILSYLIQGEADLPDIVTATGLSRTQAQREIENLINKEQIERRREGKKYLYHVPKNGLSY